MRRVLLSHNDLVIVLRVPLRRISEAPRRETSPGHLAESCESIDPYVGRCD